MEATIARRPERWPGLELRHLLALLAVSEESSFSAAGRKLGYTQSAISQQVASLERIVGKKLLERPRTGRPVRFTEAGEVVARFASIVVDELTRAYSDVRALDADGSRLRLGVTPGVGPQVLPQVLQSLGDARREIAVEVVELMADADLLALVELGEVDACFADLPLPDGPFGHVEVLHEHLLLVVQAHSPLALRGTPPSIVELAALPLLSRRDSRGDERALAALRALNPSLNVVCRSNVPETLHALVAAGIGVALLPESATNDRSGRTVALHLAEGLPPVRVGLVWNRVVRRTAGLDALIAGVSAPGPAPRATVGADGVLPGAARHHACRVADAPPGLRRAAFLTPHRPSSRGNPYPG